MKDKHTARLIAFYSFGFWGLIILRLLTIIFGIAGIVNIFLNKNNTNDVMFYSFMSFWVLATGNFLVPIIQNWTVEELEKLCEDEK